MAMDLFKRIDLQDALKKQKYWNANFSNLSKDLKIPIGTVRNHVKKMRDEGRIKVKIDILTESEAHELKHGGDKVGTE